jgi:hypothetical protein
MRHSVLTSLVAILGFATSAPVANVVCDPGSISDAHNITSNTITELAGEVTGCIQRFCADEDKGQSQALGQCGSITLAVFSHDGSLPDTATCVDQFKTVLDHCVATQGLVDGGIKTDKAFYEIFTQAPELDTRQLSAEEVQQLEVDEDEDWENIWSPDELADDEEGDGLERREDDEEDEGDEESDGLHIRDDDEEEDELEKRGRVKGASKTSKGTKPKGKKTGIKHKTNAKPKPKTKAKPKPKKKPKACPLKPKGKGTKGKVTQAKPGAAKGKTTARDVFRRTTPGSSSRHGSSPNQGSSCQNLEDIYKVRALNARRTVIHHSFNSRSDWSHYQMPQAEGPKIREVLQNMPLRGKLDVIVMRSGHTSIIGSSRGRSDPQDYEGRSGDYLLTNGGFFIQDARNVPGQPRKTLKYDYNGERFDQANAAYYSVGPSSTQPTRYIPVPPSQRHYYKEIQGDDGSYCWSGPTLKQRLDLTDPALMWRPPYADRVPGGVHTASHPNERLVYVVLPNHTKIIFVYTAADRFTTGARLSTMRNMIDAFLYKYQSRARIAEATQAVNLDGGGSIYVSFNEHGRRPKVIAAGDHRMVVPAVVANPRPVANLLKISV